MWGLSATAAYGLLGLAAPKAMAQDKPMGGTLRMNFETTNVLNEQVAQAAGFSVAARTDITSVETGLEAINFVNEQFAKATGVRTATED